MQARLETSREPQRPSPRYFGTRAGLENECQGQTANWVPFQPPPNICSLLVWRRSHPETDREGTPLTAAPPPMIQLWPNLSRTQAQTFPPKGG